MLLTLTATATPDFPRASDLGYLLHKHPDRVQQFESSVGVSHVFYPEASDDRCTVALLLEVDPIGMVRSKRFGVDGFALAQYVNDRPYAASSLLAVALGRAFGTAMKGRCAGHPELEGSLLSMEIHVPVLPARDGGVALVERLFEPLGWRVEATALPLDPQPPASGDSPYVDLTLRGEHVLADALTQLYVLLPVLDGAKHYWVSTDEVDKLIRSGASWLGTHPERDLITRRYLARKGRLVDAAAERLSALEDAVETVETADANGLVAANAKTRPLAEQRREAVLAALREVGARRVVDLGCGEGALLVDLLADPGFVEVVGIDVSARALIRAQRRLALDRRPDRQRARLRLRQSSITYRDKEIEGFDAIVLVEVIEHLDLDRLPALERSVFAHASPGAVVLTTPNADYNDLFPSLPAGDFRHPDHRFEWTRAEFQDWATRVADAHGYAVRFAPVGDVHPERGGPTQLALFTNASTGTATARGGAA